MGSSMYKKVEERVFIHERDLWQELTDGEQGPLVLHGSSVTAVNAINSRRRWLRKRSSEKDWPATCRDYERPSWQP